MATWRQNRQRINAIVAIIIIFFILNLFRSGSSSSSDTPIPPSAQQQQQPNRPPSGGGSSGVTLSHSNPSQRGEDDLELVVASTSKDNVTWLNDYLLDWHKSIYVVDDPTNPLTVAVNKGREANVFLTYIIDNYDNLPGNIIFHHAGRFQWHNDNPDYDALPLLQRFRLDHLKEEGYVNLRCVWVLGCPAEIRPSRDAGTAKPGAPIHAKHVYKEAFEEIFPEYEVPEQIGVTCCSQFAVRREAVRTRSKEDYIRYRDWLVNSPLVDDLSGRVLEYSWHIIFGKRAVHCPSAGDCYCKLYGLCDLKCSEFACDGQYTLPPFATLPKGWPKFGWQQEDRHWDGQL